MPTSRQVHRLIAIWIALPILFIALTGATYRIGRSWFGMSKATGNQVMGLHTAEWFGDTGSKIYLATVGGLFLFLIFSGLSVWFRSRAPKAPARRLHRIVGIVVALPLIVSAVTGVAYHLGETWFMQGTLDLLMTLHQGDWLGKTLRPYYILILALSIATFSITGLLMLWRSARKGPDRA
jgi:uncharacterized iron-regulated membrane protein